MPKHQPGDAQPDAALGQRLGALLRQWIVRDIDHVVHEADGRGSGPPEFRLVQVSILLEGTRDKACEVERAKKAGAIGRQGLFAAGVGCADCLAVGEIVLGINAIDEDHAGFGGIIGGAHDLVPKADSRNTSEGVTVEDEGPFRPGLHGGHEGVCHQHREIEVAQPPRLLFGGNEGLDVRMIAVHCAHHCTASRSGGHDGLAHGIPHFHEADGT